MPSVIIIFYDQCIWQITPSVFRPIVTKVAFRYQVTATVWIVCFLLSKKLNCSVQCIRLMAVSVSVFVCHFKIDRLHVLNLLPAIVICSHSTQTHVRTSEYKVLWITVWEHPTFFVSFSNTQQYQRFVITSPQYIVVAWIGPSNVRSGTFYTVSTGLTVRTDSKYSIKSLRIYLFIPYFNSKTAPGINSFGCTVNDYSYKDNFAQNYIKSIE